MVETDEGDKQIICGAPNVRKGMRVVVGQAPACYVSRHRYNYSDEYDPWDRKVMA